MKPFTGILLAAVLAAFPAVAARAASDEVTIGPDYAPAPELTADPNIPHGTVHELVMSSADSKIYPGIVRLDNAFTQKRDAHGNKIAAAAADQSAPGPYQRKVAVYVPAGYTPGTPAPLMVVQDGHGFETRLVPVLDNLINAKRLPPMIVVMADSGGGDAQGSERGLEYDTISDTYARWVETELLPKVAKDYNLTFTTDPNGRATFGASSGGIAAFTMAWFHPEWYHRVLTYSGTFVNQQSPVNPDTPRGGWEYHDHLIANAPKKPLRMWLEVGENDNHFDDPEETWHNWVTANNRMAAVLKAKGYTYRYVFAKGAKHTDGRVIAQTLPDALQWLWADYKP
jgi:enterochelin esterase-like enzyme